MPTKLDPIHALRAIFLDVSVSTRRRIEAADMRARQTLSKRPSPQRDFLQRCARPSLGKLTQPTVSADDANSAGVSWSRNGASKLMGAALWPPPKGCERRSSQRRFHPSRMSIRNPVGDFAEKLKLRARPVRRNQSRNGLQDAILHFDPVGSWCPWALVGTRPPADAENAWATIFRARRGRSNRRAPSFKMRDRT
jgi:hypothetical protein